MAERDGAPGSPRIREVESPVLLLVGALLDVLAGVTLGSIGTFLLLLVIGILEEETGLFQGAGVTLDLDALFRSSMGSVLISWAAMAVMWPGVLIAERAAALAAGEAFAARHPLDAPPHDLRERLRGTPGDLLRTTGLIVFWIGAGLAALFLIVTLVMLADGEDGEVGWILVAAAAALAALGYGMLVLGRRVAAGQRRRVDALRSAWDARAKAADRSERTARRALPTAELPRMLRRRRPAGRLSAAGPWLLGIGASVFMLSVVLRQPCRGCEPNTWGEGGERLIDSLSTAGGGILTVLGAVCIGLWVFSVVRLLVAEEVLRRWLAASPVVQVEGDRLHELLVRPSAGRLAAMTLAGFGTSLLIVAGGVAMIEWEGLDASIALAVGRATLFAAVLIAYVAQRRQVGIRRLVRERTLPGDPTGESVARRRRRGDG